METSSVAQAKSRLGVAVRYNNHRAETEARRDLAAAKLEAYIAKTVAAAPPLTPEQRDKLAAILHGGDTR